MALFNLLNTPQDFIALFLIRFFKLTPVGYGMTKNSRVRSLRSSWAEPIGSVSGQRRKEMDLRTHGPDLASARLQL